MVHPSPLPARQPHRTSPHSLYPARHPSRAVAMQLPTAPAQAWVRLLAWGLIGGAAATGMSLARAQNAYPSQAEMGRVLSSVPVIQQVAVPRQVCTQEQVVVPGQKSGAGAAMGGIAGGALGNQIGSGSGRAVATMIGLMGGAILGDRVEGNAPAQTQTLQRCTQQTIYENRTVGYNVTYEYADKQYTVQMPQDPGAWVQLQVTPVVPPPGNAYPQPPASYPTTPSPQSLAEPVQPPVAYIGPTVITSGTTFLPNPYAGVHPTVVVPAVVPSAFIRLDLSNRRDWDRWPDHRHYEGHGRWR